jgi:transposase
MRYQYCGTDVGSEKLDVAVEWKGKIRSHQFDNDAPGIDALWRFLKSEHRETRVAFEGTGTYGFGMSIFLCQKGVSVMRVNPKASRNFAECKMRRAKTDRIDANVLLEFCKTMDFVKWEPPRQTILNLRAFAARMQDLNKMETAERNRLHAVKYIPEVDKAVIEDIEASIESIATRITSLEAKMYDIVKNDEELKSWYDAMTSIKGIAKRSACLLLADLAVLPEDMSAKEVVAHAGLDPKPRESGKSHPTRRISRVGVSGLRSTLFFPAMTAAVHEPAVVAFYHRLVDVRHKEKMLATVAVMRKLLVVVWTMRRTRASFDGTLFSKAA